MYYEIHSDDAMLPPYLLREDGKHYLEAMAIEHLGVRPWKHLKDVDLKDYGAKDVIYTYRLWQKTWGELDEESRRLYQHILLPVSRAFAAIERTGIYVDPETFALGKRHYQEESKRLRERLVVLAEELGLKNFNPGSNRQLATLIYHRLGLPCDEWTKTGQPATGEDALKRLNHPVVSDILALRHAQKMDSTYLTGWEKFIEADGRMYPSYFVVTGAYKGQSGGTVTGRSSASKPAIQTIPREGRIRSILAAPPGKLLISADFSQLELRVGAWLANETSMLQAFSQGQDIHMEMAKAILAQKGITDRLPTKEERSRAKPPNFMFLYGGSPQKYQELALKDYDTVVNYDEALQVYRAFHERWSGFGPWYRSISDILKATGSVRTPFGRVRHLPGIHSFQQPERAEALRAGINFLVQATATADITFIGLILLHRAGYKVVAFMHDGYLIEVAEGSQETEHIRSILESEVPAYALAHFGVDITVPLTVDIEVGRNWK